MGNEQSNQYDGCTTLGYRVLGVQPNSPASRAGLVSFFDFLVGVNGQLLFDNGEHDDSNGEYFEDLDFVAFLKDNVDQEIELLVWNIKNKTQRFINLTPTRNWEGTGLLGVTIRMDDYVTAEENLLRILDIQAGSPASFAGMTPKIDYLLGTTMESFENEEVLGDVLYENEDQELEVYVYNTETDMVRVVTIIPSLNWGGQGLLGAEVGRGYLHRLPQSCRASSGTSFERKVTIGANDHIVQIVDKENIGDLNVSADQRKLTPGGDGAKEMQESVGTPEEVGTMQTDAAAGKEGIRNEVHPVLPEENQDCSGEAEQTLQNEIPVASPLNFPPPPTLVNSSEIGKGVEAIALDDDLPPPPIAVFDDSTDGADDNLDLR
mmetsp:Transcript_1664/g.2528  ORF Transcript_1664/g.2528 Transcript_1664/m.2528 type:complete len:377 (-) Transcript_1664:3978-5108(-)